MGFRGVTHKGSAGAGEDEGGSATGAGGSRRSGGGAGISHSGQLGPPVAHVLETEPVQRNFWAPPPRGSADIPCIICHISYTAYYIPHTV